MATWWVHEGGGVGRESTGSKVPGEWCILRRASSIRLGGSKLFLGSCRRVLMGGRWGSAPCHWRGRGVQ